VIFFAGSRLYYTFRSRNTQAQENRIAEYLSGITECLLHFAGKPAMMGKNVSILP
jgi:hypothetical protein